MRIEAFDWQVPNTLWPSPLSSPGWSLHSALYEISPGDKVIRLIGQPNQPFGGLWLSPSANSSRLPRPANAGRFRTICSCNPWLRHRHDVTASVDRAVLDARCRTHGHCEPWSRTASPTDWSRCFRGTPTTSSCPIPCVRSTSPATARSCSPAWIQPLPELFVRLANGSVTQIGELQRGWEVSGLPMPSYFTSRASMAGHRGALHEAASAARAPGAAGVLVHGVLQATFADYFWFNAWPQLLAAAATRY